VSYPPTKITTYQLFTRDLAKEEMPIFLAAYDLQARLIAAQAFGALPYPFWQEEEPVPPINPGSTWTKPSAPNLAYAWNGVAWVSLQGPTGEQGPPGLDGLEGDQGLQGPEGPAGTPSYTHIAWTNVPDSTEGFSLSDSTNKLYIGMYVDDQPSDSSDPTDYFWTLIKGADGSQGIQGEAGDDGQTPYLHIAYATAADGSTGFSTTVSAGKTHIGTFTDFVQADSETYSDYTWALFKGADGSPGSAGANGERGAGAYHLSVVSPSPISDATFTLFADELTPGGNVFQDRVTIFNGTATPPWSITKFWDGAAWQVLTQYLDGNLLVSGTVAASKIAAGSFVAVGGSAADITTISGSKITTGTLSADKIDANGISANIITAGTLNVDRINAGSINGTKLADSAVNGLKLKCAMGTLAINHPAYAAVGVGFGSSPSAARVDIDGYWAIRVYTATAMSGTDYVVLLQNLGLHRIAPHIAAKTSGYFDVLLHDGANWIDPSTLTGTLFTWSVLALDT
jgi:hypothetical protein